MWEKSAKFPVLVRNATRLRKDGKERLSRRSPKNDALVEVVQVTATTHFISAKIL